MVWVRLGMKDGWVVPLDVNDKVDWICPDCKHEHYSCCGNSHLPCRVGVNHGGTCKCNIDLMMPVTIQTSMKTADLLRGLSISSVENLKPTSKSVFELSSIGWD